MRSSRQSIVAIVSVLLTPPALAQLTPPASVRPASPGPRPIATPRTAPTLIPTKRLTITYRSQKWAVVRVATADATLSCSNTAVPQQGSVTNTCTADVAQGRSVTISGYTSTLTGTGQPPYIGKLWGGDCAASHGASCTVRMDADRSILIGL